MNTPLPSQQPLPIPQQANTTFEPAPLPAPLPTQVVAPPFQDPQPRPSQAGGSPHSHSQPTANPAHPARSLNPAAFLGANEAEAAELCKAYEKFEQLVSTCMTQFEGCSDIQFVGGGAVWVHQNGADKRTSFKLDNTSDLLMWAKMFGRGGDGDIQLQENVRGSV